MSLIKEEIRRRVPRLTMSLVIALIFLAISIVIPPTISTIVIPGLNVDTGFLVWIITTVITAIFLIRALFDALVLGDVVTDIIVRRLGIKGERSPRRAARDLIYIIIIILIATAILPIITAFQSSLGTQIVSWITSITIYVSLGIILILIYDIGRILYRIIEKRAESLADQLSKIVEQNENSD